MQSYLDLLLGAGNKDEGAKECAVTGGSSGGKHHGRWEVERILVERRR